MSEQIIEHAVAIREQAGAVDRALSVDEIKQRLDFIKTVMARNMAEGQDYGKIPGCGDKPGLFQPGAQKLALTFQLSPTVAREVLRELRSDHREYEFTLAVSTVTGRVLANGVGTCSTLESKYRFRGGARKCPECGKESIIKGKKEYGGGWLCFQKKGGCGAKWEDGDSAIEAQSVERVEHDNPADFWNTVRKMAFKRALVHGMINATNTSELWSQDLEDIAENGHVEEKPATKAAAPKAPPTQRPTTKPPAPKPPTNGKTLAERIEGMKSKMGTKLDWAVSYLRSFTVEGSDANSSLMPNESLEALTEQSVVWLANNWPDFVSRLDSYIAEREAEADQIPGAEVPVQPELGGAPAPPSVNGVISNVSVKTGTSKRGDWILFGISIDNNWHNTFSKTLGDFALACKGKEAQLFYEKTEKGSNALAIRCEGKLVEASA